MPLPKPGEQEEREAYLSRFMQSEEAKKEYPDIKQRYAVAVSKWKSKEK
jgi:hypothetical protein